MSRTQAGEVASVINNQAAPGDFVLYCPDQLGPAAARLIHTPVNQITFPRGSGPTVVNWVDYRKVFARTNSVAFGEDTLRRAENSHVVWYVYADYDGVGNKCRTLLSLFQAVRTGGQLSVQLKPSPGYEAESLFRFPVA